VGSEVTNNIEGLTGSNNYAIYYEEVLRWLVCSLILLGVLAGCLDIQKREFQQVLKLVLLP
jgi:predicted ferric reductase